MKFATRILPLRKDRRSLDICFDLNTPPHHKFYFVWCLILAVLLLFFHDAPITIWTEHFLSLLLHIFALIRFKFSIGAFQIDANFFLPVGFSLYRARVFSGFHLLLLFTGLAGFCQWNSNRYQPHTLWYVLAKYTTANELWHGWMCS